jgi:anti-sigma regulatory factor (Ser/Thr protein kinase)
LEAAAKVGQILIDIATYGSLPDELKDCYDEEEVICGKREERFLARRCSLSPDEGTSAAVRPSLPRGEQERQLGDSLRAGRLNLRLNWSDSETVNLLATTLSEELERRGFSSADRIASRIALKELINNGKHTAATSILVGVELSKSRVTLSVEDSGKGFDWGAVLARLSTELEAGGREHGLLRSMRYGTAMRQMITPHRVCWWRDRHPETLPSVFDGIQGVVPVVFDYESGFLRIADEVRPRLDPTHSVGQSDAILEPLRRASNWVVAIEVRGQHNTEERELPSVVLVRTILGYLRRRCQGKRLVIFANTEPEDHRELAFLSGSVPDSTVEFFEDWAKCTATIAEWLASGRPA